MLTPLTGVPVVTTIMGKGAVPSTHPLYAGNIGIHGSFATNSAVSGCDVLFSIGTRFNDRITGKNGATQFLELNEERRLLTSGGLGTMGYGLPAALGSKIGNPNKTVVLITGDGGLQMNMQEPATAVVCGLRKTPGSSITLRPPFF